MKRRRLITCSLLAFGFSLTIYAQTAVVPFIIQISGQFLGTPYQLEPLGEGKTGQFNQQPLLRLDRFDCQTYVDTVLALSLATARHQSVLPLLLQLRYRQGKPTFANRLHFPSADWLPNVVRKRFLIDITSRLGQPDQLTTVTSKLNRPQWYQHLTLSRIQIPSLCVKQQKLTQLHALSKTVKTVPITLTYLKLSALPAVAAHIPNGTVILIVNPPSAYAQQQLGTAMLISHMGFAIWHDHQLWLRAASSRTKQVVDVALLSYLQQMPGIKGIVVLQVVT